MKRQEEHSEAERETARRKYEEAVAEYRVARTAGAQRRNLFEIQQRFALEALRLELWFGEKVELPE